VEARKFVVLSGEKIYTQGSNVSLMLMMLTILMRMLMRMIMIMIKMIYL